MAKYKVKHKTDDDPEGPGQKVWHVYIDGADKDLDTIKSVEYELPPYFPRPEVKGRDRQNKFSVDASGSTNTVISAKIVDPTGTYRVSHTLSTESKEGETDVC
jgi:hypothetical protein